ncbi:ferritin-like domain-containing protein [uncultured Rhodoferax sp.]|uniref:ferritin-like domain-containing protein n=1 Tax=uncultured Rhodoferax sp. TaxID=223188 RepID=UPI0025E7E448|nr:ferritin-like domain-containing protein [uncultured Rhodoferax sp.]
MELRHLALHAFEICDPLAKAEAIQAMAAVLPSLPVITEALLPWPEAPGRPTQPELVQPKEVPRRSPFTLEGHAALVHSIAHIEFNAINLALDAVWRFPNMPERYYRDWMQVALEESQHFTMLEAHLRRCGYRYGTFPAHDGLWTMCENTRHDVVARMALVPRTLEARGLDATPVIQAKLRKVGTPQALEVCSILDTILREEVGHVTVGNHWFHWLCQRDGLDAPAFYAHAAVRHAAPRPKPPFNLEARRRAGFSESELQSLQTVAPPEPAPV